MVFKRRDKLKPLTKLAHLLWPKGGWSRAVRYMSHRLHRLPDTPTRISRGILVGVFVAFTPFLGLHFVLAALLALLLRGNILAAILSTFVGNPLTYFPIALISLKTGHFLLGENYVPRHEQFFGTSFVNASRDLVGNFMAMLTGMPQDWVRLGIFWHDVFWPYLIGGLVLGTLAGIASYQLSFPVITAYQKRRRGRLRAPLKALKKKAAQLKKPAEAPRNEDASKTDTHTDMQTDTQTNDKLQ